jgi:hypothetical protein
LSPYAKKGSNRYGQQRVPNFDAERRKKVRIIKNWKIENSLGRDVQEGVVAEQDGYQLVKQYDLVSGISGWVVINKSMKKRWVPENATFKGAAAVFKAILLGKEKLPYNPTIDDVVNFNWER